MKFLAFLEDETAFSTVAHCGTVLLGGATNVAKLPYIKILKFT